VLPVLNGWQLPVGRVRPIFVVIFDPLLCDLSDLFKVREEIGVQYFM
jgi:hypothetical protein